MNTLSTKIRELISQFLRRQPAVAPSRQSESRLRYHNLEGRELLAGIIFLENVGEVLIGGTTGNDVASVMQSGDTITVSHEGFGSQQFSISEVEQIRFVGLAGDDRFENQSSVRSLIFGQAGNDTLIGGSGADRLIGNNGNDVLIANGGDDVIIAGIGDDNVSAGDGNDRVFGVSGTNQIDGGAGNDTIFGGIEVDIITDPSGANRIAGADGDDQITGGVDVDTVFGGGGDDLIFGNAGDDFIYGQADNDTLVGNAGEDVLNGNDGDDNISSQFGDDRVVGGPGADISNYSGNSAEYFFEEFLPDRFRVNDLRGPQFGGVDTVLSIESLNFSNGAGSPDSFLNPTPTGARERVVVQPIIAANTDGSNQAEYFGNDSQQADIFNRIDEIFAQANIDVQFLPAVDWNNTFVNIGNGSGERSGNDLSTIVRQGDAAGLGSSDSRVVDLYFVERVPEFTNTGDSVANGLAFVGISGIAIHIGDNLVNSASGREVVAEVTAHEIAHNLGIFHSDEPGNLLTPSGGGANLNQTQINTLLNSRISQPI